LVDEKELVVRSSGRLVLMTCGSPSDASKMRDRRDEDKGVLLGFVVDVLLERRAIVCQ
jgi:hypothetical protein